MLVQNHKDILMCFSLQLMHLSEINIKEVIDIYSMQLSPIR